ncbi:methyltransferase domain-containing protein [Skermanella sp. TT6]|uniref:Methyltransferase domain-containing protein n=1 Tax=Skermanella cutis TaxID=2775420 RepID=A0ABX7B873_9PROT|nr:methyltransferase domain-containing protein [Skermanella sp. TT6]QQP88682.1 methyltransferase domain-containing protein [Skermanella sp. TT6]
MQLRVSPAAPPRALSDSLVCPRCRAPLIGRETGLACTAPQCGRVYPIVDGTPILIHDENSVFAVADFTARRGGEGAGPETIKLRGEAPARGLKAALRRAAERAIYFSVNASDWSSEKSVDYVARALPEARILVTGAGDKRYPDLPNVRYVYTDVILGQGADHVCDLHDLPFADATFDAVIAVAVLEHVADPYRCVAEIARVLKPGGYVYSVTPFMQQVHMGRYDFTRFTFLGHRRLFRHFTEIKAGMALGPAGALAWSFEYFVLSFFRGRRARKYARAAAKVATLPLKYLDRVLAKREGSLDAAGGVYFFGTKAEQPISDRDLLKFYRGLDVVYED